MRPTPKDKKIRILKRLFSGETYPSAAKNENSSTSTVKKIFDELVDYAASSSLEEAAENYGVKEEIEVLREIACEARKAGSSFPELLAGARLLLLLKKLGLSPVQLEDTIKALNKHKDRFGDFIQSSLRLASLEEESGKKYEAIIEEYKNIKTKVAELSEEMEQTRVKFAKEKKAAKKKIESLDKEIQTRESQLIMLDKRAQNAQKIIDQFDRTNTELYRYGIGYGDFKTVKNFLNDIQKLGGNGVKAVQMIEEDGSLANKLSRLKSEIEKNERLQRTEQLTYERRMEELKTRKQELEGKIIEDENRVGTLRTEKVGLLEKITKLQKKRQQLECQVDGLQKMLAERLAVQPEIDVIYETIPIRKKELKELEEKIEAKKHIVSVAVAFENLLQKNPADRKTLINWLMLGGVSKEFSSIDNLARQKITEILAKEGYLPKTDLDLARMDFQRKIKKADEDAEREKRLARRRLEELEQCGNLLRQAHQAIKKQENEELDKAIADFFVTVLSHKWRY